MKGTMQVPTMLKLVKHQVTQCLNSCVKSPPTAPLVWFTFYYIFVMFGYSVIIFTSIAIVEATKILIVVPTPSISHQVIFRPLIQELVKRNHDVVVVTTDPIYPQGASPNSLSEISLHDLSYTLWYKLIRASVAKCDLSDVLSIMKATFNVLSKVFEEQLQDKSIQNIITNKTTKFDLLILEGPATPALIFSYIFKAPVIQMSSFGAKPGDMKIIGGLTHPFLYPTHYHQRLYNLTIWEKIGELYNHVTFDRMLENQEFEDDNMLQSLFGIDTPTLNELKNNVHMLFLNIHHVWLHNQPVPFNVVYTWGIHKVPNKSLPKDLQSYLDSSKNGAIYISFGTNFRTSLIPRKRLEILVQVFSRLPYNILWKWDMDELPGKSENIKISRWLPQSDVLRHPNLKLFITQGGLQSTEEAINAGVPLIGIPMFADQEYNTEKYIHFKIGVKLDFKSLSVESFENAINTIFTDYESYQANIIQLRTQMHDQPKPALENAIWWIEYVLRNGGARHLRAPAANMAWAEYYELNLVFIILSVTIVLGTVLALIMYSCFKLVSYNYLQRVFINKVSTKTEEP